MNASRRLPHAARTLRPLFAPLLPLCALLFSAGCALLLAAGCAAQNAAGAASAPSVPAGERLAMPAYENDRKLSAWVVYWDTEGAADELARYGDALEAVCYFEAYFEESGAPALPNELVRFRRLEAEQRPWTSYLTFVNDVKKKDGSFSNKDTGLLKRLLADEAAMDAHADALVSLTSEQGFDGIELDYEAIKGDEALWTQYAAFVGRLYARAQAAGLRVRVVLEPGAPFDLFSQISGPDYVVMCYNLYGSHSGAGPKATPAFIAETVQKAACLPGRVDFALATGGFEWPAGGKASALTERDALSLLAAFGSDDVRRDAESGCVVFSYRGADKKRREVWYADGDTLALWAYAVKSAGNYGVSLWRIGGNAAESCLAGAFMHE